MSVRMSKGIPERGKKPSSEAEIDTHAMQLVGGKAAFEEFMKAYLKEFAFKTINSQQFKDFFLTYFRNKAEVQEIDWQLWYYGRGEAAKSISFSHAAPCLIWASLHSS